MKTILCFGDSLTWCLNPENWARYEYDIRWTTILEVNLGKDFKVIVDGLNGRTTCWNHPFLPNRSGKEQFPLSLETHAPIDLVIIMLGTNDMVRYLNVAAEDSAKSMFAYYLAVQGSLSGPNEAAPKMLVVSPPALGKVNDFMSLWYHGNLEESKKLAGCLKTFCDELNIPFLDSNEVIKASEVDGVHISPESNRVLGEKIAGEVLKILA